MNEKQSLISIVVPLYNEKEALQLSFDTMNKVMQDSGYNYEFIYVDDGSADNTWEILQQIAKTNKCVKGFKFSRNFGHQLAVTAGIAQAKGDAVVIIDADLQDPPEVIIEMIKKWEQGFEVVYGQRKKRKGESVFKLITAFAYYRTLKALSTFQIPLDTGDFRLIDKKVAKVLTNMKEHNRFLRGMAAWAGFKQCPVEYVRNERVAGSTKYTFKKMVNLALSGILGFSYKPLLMPLSFGAFIVFASILSSAICLITGTAQKIGFEFVSFQVILMLFGLLFVFLGIMGAYISRIIDETLKRPLYIISQET